MFLLTGSRDDINHPQDDALPLRPLDALGQSYGNIQLLMVLRTLEIFLPT